MTEKAKVARDHETGDWVAIRPRLGFGGSESRTFPSQQAAMAWLDNTIGRQGTLAGQTERFTAGRGMNVHATATDGRPW